MELQNPLWQFVLQIYSDAEIERSCLQLQNDHGVSINRLLFAAWLATQGRGYDSTHPALEEATHWQQRVTHPVREVRYRVRAMREDAQPVAEVYQQLRRAELAAEQQELALLWQMYDCLPRVQAGSTLLIENLTAVVHQAGHPAFEALLSALGQRLFATQPSE